MHLATIRPMLHCSSLCMFTGPLALSSPCKDACGVFAVDVALALSPNAAHWCGENGSAGLTLISDSVGAECRERRAEAERGIPCHIHVAGSSPRATEQVLAHTSYLSIICDGALQNRLQLARVCSANMILLAIASVQVSSSQCPEWRK